MSNENDTKVLRLAEGAACLAALPSFQLTKKKYSL